MRNLFLIVFAIAIVNVLISFGIWFFIFHRTAGSYFDNNGVKIYYTVEGEGEPVVLVHGFAVNGDMNFRRMGVNDALSKNYRVITLDIRGHGLSDKPHNREAYGEQMALDVVALLDYLHIGQAHLVGYSLGGFISLKCAVLFPDRWKSLTIFGSAWEDYENGRAFKALKMVEEAYKEGKPLGAAMDYFEGRDSPYLVKFLVVYFSSLINDDKALGAVIGGLDGLMISTEELKCISIPTCGIVGDEDPFLESAKAMEGKMQNCKLTIIKGGDHLTTPRKSSAKKTLLEFLHAH